MTLLADEEEAAFKILSFANLAVRLLIVTVAEVPFETPTVAPLTLLAEHEAE
jgi:hypothetical protein